VIKYTLLGASNEGGLPLIRDPWEPLAHRPSPHQAVLSSVEVTVTNMCNLRCAHCAVGDQLMGKDPFRLPVETIIDALDQAPDLKTLSLTGGEPMVSREVVEQRSEEHTSELQSRENLVCRLLLEKKKWPG